MYIYRRDGKEIDKEVISLEVGSGFIHEIEMLARKRPNKETETQYAQYKFSVEYKLADVSMMEGVQLHFRGEYNGKYEFGYNGYDNVYVYTNPGEFYFDGNCGERFEHSRSFSPDEALAIVKFIEVNWPDWRELAKLTNPKRSWDYDEDYYDEDERDF